MNILPILWIQVSITFVLVFLRTHSVNRTLMKPPKDYKAKLLSVLSQPGNSIVKHLWKLGAIRRQLILLSSVPRLYTNEDDYSSITVSDSAEKQLLIEKLNANEQPTKKIYGFFHPYCNAGGGGEKVLWKAVETTLQDASDNVVIIYTGDSDVNGSTILQNVIDKFDYNLDKDRIVFIFLKYRYLVDSNTWSHFTLLGQALGSIILSIEALLRCPPDVWCDTMGYSFGYPWVYHLLRIPIVAYTHYPVISTDMLNKLLNQKQTLKVKLKYCYWKLFMLYYQHMGTFVSISITNSTWTNNHIKQIWSKADQKIIYPPCSTEKLVRTDNSTGRTNQAIILAQFRPEKRHKLIISSYGKFIEKNPTLVDKLPNLLFIGSTRSKSDEDYVKELREYGQELNIPDKKCKFMLNVSYDEIKDILNASKFGINAMWNEHFGIAVVEYLAAGLIPIVHASAGPLLDIVIDDSVGFFFKDETDPDFTNYETYKSLDVVLQDAINLDEPKRIEMSETGQKIAVEKFSDMKFNDNWQELVLNKLNKKDK
ncbi:hypothetical protein KAFR_0H03470 [Kazachstania africana CBS 2517]|uniref:GDP-Man:Man(3)GlcNAc(2)-PP-Dol alpha-1,2-mannosyltransferase n=1 Tax=Kazachstania africana (strain ATCC 22294 / BCRC 22015 / CBS 2517 / CECT 1963 / NBRC 1671 / NRRL Y-8276) TaxID=1071382 RepID=H2AYI0_KAZAF|nr:hypothetical protein KAFR_0H03470 [Kazachstania africana CBS 2517]CCF59757.1 hypothetical protein KAFR_0H03470 [Kazachstania africana CBS 2517]